MVRLSVFFVFNLSLFPHIVYHTKADTVITKEISLAAKRFSIKDPLVFKEVDSLELPNLLAGYPNATVFGFDKNEFSKTGFENVRFYESTLMATIQQEAVQFDRITIAGKSNQIDATQVSASKFFCYDADLRTFYKSSENQYKSIRTACIDRKSSEPTLLLDINRGKKNFQFQIQSIQKLKNTWVYTLTFQSADYNEIILSFPEKVELLSKPFLNNHSMENSADHYRSKNLFTDNTLTIITLNQKLREINIEGYKNDHLLETSTIDLNEQPDYRWFLFFFSLLPISLYLKKALSRTKNDTSSYSNRLAEGETMNRADLPAAMQALIPEFMLFNLGGKIMMKDNNEFNELIAKWKTLGLKVKITDEKYKELTGGVNKSLKIKIQI